MKVFSFVLLLLFSMGCASSVKDKEKTETSIPSVSIDLSRAQYIKWDSLVDTRTVKVVPLETTEESLLGRIGKVFVAEDRFLIVTGSSMYLFDENGKFLTKISKQGKGPGEYLQLLDAYLDHDCIYALDCRGQKIFKYSFDGVLMEQYTTGVLGRTFAKVSDDLIAIYCDSDMTERSDCRLNLFSLSSRKIVGKYFPVTKNEYEWRYINDVNNFQVTDSVVYFVYSLNDTIYKIDQRGEIKIAKVLDFGPQRIPAPVLQEKYTDIVQFMEKITEMNCVNMVTPVYIDPQGLFCGIWYKDKKLGAWEENGKVHVAEGYNNFLNVEGFRIKVASAPIPLYCRKGFFYAMLEAHQIPDSYKEEIVNLYQVSFPDNENNPYLLIFEALAK